MVLQNTYPVANGSVGFAPRKSEWYHQPFLPTIFAGSGVDDWYDLLASHEYRHVVQLDAANTGSTKLMSLLFGDTGRQAMTFLSIPSWFFEGDAVGMETAVGLGGRGRLPWFEMHTRALLLEDINYSYPKALHRSYKHYYASQYPLGYELTTYVKKEHGVDAWRDVLDKTSRYSFLPLSFNRSVRNTLGANMNTIYDRTMDDLKVEWEKSLHMIQISNGILINDATHKSSWTSYAFPEILDDGGVIAVKTSLENPAKWVRFDAEGNEKVGNRADSEAFSYGFNHSNGKITWHRTLPDLRWGLGGSSVIMIQDLESGKTKQLTSGSNLTLPALSSDASQVAAVEFTKDRLASLIIYDVESGREIERIGMGANDFIMSPSWSPDDSKIVVMRQTLAGKAMTEIDLKTRRTRDIIEAGTEDINEPQHQGNVIYYQSSRSGIENIWAIDLESNKRYQITSRIVGAMHPSISKDGKTLIYNDYSTMGFDIFEAPIDRRKWKYAPQVRDRVTKYYQEMLDQEEVGPYLLTSTANYDGREVKDYSGIKNLFKFHSWAPILSEDNVGLTLNSSNLLNTFQFDLIADHDRKDHKWKNTVRATYSGLYPIFQIDASQEWQEERTSCDARGTENLTSCSVQEIDARIILPLNLSRGINNRFLKLYAGGEALRAAPRSTIEDPAVLWVNSYNFGLTASQFRNGAFRDFWPGFSQALSFEYEKTTPESGATGQRTAFFGLAYIPGLLKQHKLRVRASVEVQNPDTWLYETDLDLARGYDFVFRNQLSTFGIDYKFPLSYPDIAIGNLVFVKRVLGGFFYDHSMGNSESLTTSVEDFSARSAGAELRFDFHLFDWPLEFQAGVRAGVRLDDLMGPGDQLDKKGFFVKPVVFGVGF